MTIAQTPPPHFAADWIGHSWMYDTASDRNTYFAFRKAVTLPAEPRSATMRITADARYILWIDGAFVGRGPARSVPSAQSFDTHDVGPFLRRGTNVIAVLVHQFGVSNYQYVHRLRTGLLVDGVVECTDGATVPLRTDASWQTRLADWYRDNGCRISIPMGFQEWVELGREPEGWRVSAPESDTTWQPAFYLGPAGTAPWSALEERGIPNLAEETTEGTLIGAMQGKNPEGFRSLGNIRLVLARDRAEKMPLPRPDADGWITIRHGSPDRFSRLDFAFPVEIVACPSLEVLAAKEGEIVDSACCLVVDSAGTPIVNDGFASPREGACDRLVTRKGMNHWESFLGRGFRYLTVVARAEMPLKIRVRAKRLGYPTAPLARFSCDTETLNRTWAVCDASLKSVMLDAFVDNGFREQAQWLHDAVVNARAAMALYGDTALFRRSLRQFANLKMPDGSLYSVGPIDFAFMNLTESNFMWINGLADYYRNTADLPLVRELSDTLRSVVAWAERNMTREGLFMSPEGNQLWIDWSLLERRPCTLTVNLMLLSALEDARALLAAIGDGEGSGSVGRFAESLRRTVHDRFWCAERALWKEWVKPDGAAWESFLQRRQPGGWANLSAFPEVPYETSLHGNALVLLLDVGGAEEKRAAVSVVMNGLDIAASRTNAMGPPWAERIIGSLFKAGEDRAAVKAIVDWYGRELAQGITTFPEQFGMVHGGAPGVPACGATGQGYASCIAHAMSRYVLGCSPAVPGWSEVTFAPRPGSLSHAEGSVPTPFGYIAVQWVHKDREIHATLQVPAGIVVKPAGTAAPVLRGPGRFALTLPC